MGFGDKFKTLTDQLLSAGVDSVLNQVQEMQKAQKPSVPMGKQTQGGGAVPTESATDSPQTLFFDPFALVEQLGYKEKPSSISYNALKGMVWRTPIVGSVIQTRAVQVAEFAQPQHDKYGIGFRVRLRDRERKPTTKEQKWSKSMEEFLINTGVDPYWVTGRDNFKKFLFKYTRDSLMLDQGAFEKVRNRRGEVAEFYAVDGSSIRIAHQASQYLKENLDQATQYVQVYDGQIINQYTRDEMALGIRNPRTDMRSFGYGTSELEMMISVVTSLLWSWQYNANYFKQGGTTPGILNLKGQMPLKQLQSFRRFWYQMVSGVENAWRSPVVNANEGIDWVKLQENNKDMEFSAWFDFLIKLVCSFYNMDPAELNFKYGNTGQGNAMGEENNRQRISESRTRGLRPLLKHISGELNQHIIWPLNPEFELEFVGLDAQTHDEEADLVGKQVKTWKTVNEIRAENDLKPLEHGDIILDPQYGAAASAAQQAEQMKAQQEQMGEGDEEEDFDFSQFFGSDEEDEEDDNKPAKPPGGGDKVNKALVSIRI